MTGTRERWSQAARYTIVGLLAGVALCWGTALRRAPASQTQGTSAGDAAGTIAFTSGGNGPGQLLFMIDTKSQAFAVYRVDPQNPKGSVKLEAVRQYKYDLKLTEFNNQPPEVAAIESMVGSPRK